MWADHTGYRDAHGTSRIQQDLSRTFASNISQANGDMVPPEEPEMLRATTAKARPIRIAIIGAGLSGLRCADVLLNKGCQVTIFEARNRLGGRVAQSNHHLGRPVDLGPNWIHGTDNNPIDKIAKSTGTELHEWDETQALFNTDGHRLDPKEAEEYGSLLWDDGIITEAFRYSNENCKSIDPSRSLYDFFVDKSMTMFQDLTPDLAQQKREKLLNIATVWGAYVGSHVKRQSLKFYWMEECIEGENPFVAGTYDRILAEIVRPAKQGATINLNSRVNKIISGADHDDSSSHPQLSLELTTDPNSHQFDEIVVTCPLGYLKRNYEALFDPPLPSRLTSAIHNLSYGSLDKIYITFPRAFWNEPHPYPSFTHFLPPIYTSQNPSGWDLQAINLAALRPASVAQPTLLFYIYGDCATHVGEIVSSSPTPAEKDSRLIAFLMPYISRLPNYAPKDPDCIPKAVLATAWVNDELAGFGSYANFQVGLERGDEDVEVLRRGLPERGLWFAGEHTAPFVALGTSTGAYWSGEKVAERILGAYGLVGVQDQTSGSWKK